MEPGIIVNRYRALESQRKTLDTLLNDIDQYFVPYRGEFFNDLLTEHQVEVHRTQIFDSTGVVAVQRLASFVHSNLTSPIVKWFGLRFRDEELNSEPEAKEWLEDTEERAWQSLQESDFDNSSAEVFKDIVSFGTAILMQEQKDDIEWKGMDFTALPVMDSYFEMGPDGIPYRIYRRLRYTRLELEERFPDMPDDLRLDDTEESSVDAKIEVVFCVYHREDADDDINAIQAPEDRPIGYKYILLNSSVELEEGGYYLFPAKVIRWDKTAGSKWGNSPAHYLLSDVKQLNELVAQTSEARAKAIDPPQKTTDRGVIGDLDLSPGGLTVVGDMEDLAPLLAGSDFVQADIERERLQASIRSGFFIDQITYKESPAMTATEVLERKQLMMQFMSPTMGRIKSDFLDPLIKNTVMMLMRQGQLKELPEALADAELDIEYTGPLPRAQKGEIAAGIERWMIGIANLAELFPEMMDIPDVDQVARTLQELSGVPAKLAHTDDEVQEIRAARAEKMAQQEEIATLTAGGEAMQAAGEGADAITKSAGLLEAVGQ